MLNSETKLLLSGFRTWFLILKQIIMKKKLLLMLCLINVTCAYAQLKVTNNGNVGIGTNNPTTKLQIYGEGCLISNTGQWGRSFWVKVNNDNACAYHLWSERKQRDVFYVCEAGYLYTLKGGYFGSDSTLKCDFQKIQSPLGNLMKLNGFKYRYKDDTTYRMGLIAQEVEKVFPEVVKTMPDKIKALTYTDFIAVIIEAIKEQQTQISTLQNVVAQQEKDILDLKDNLNQCCGIELKSRRDSIYTANFSETIDSAMLFENIPNPFSVNTEIKFILPPNNSTAKIAIYNLQGLELQSYNLTQSGNGSIIIQGSEFQAGMYLYSLFVDNVLIDTKRMVLTK